MDGHLGATSVIVKSDDAIAQFLMEIDSGDRYLMALKIEAEGLLKAIKEAYFRFTVFMVHRILSPLDPPNKVLQDKKTDIYTGVKVGRSALGCLEKLWSHTKKSSSSAKQELAPSPSTPAAVRSGEHCRPGAAGERWCVSAV